jgi:hypothetical protein
MSLAPSAGITQTSLGDFERDLVCREMSRDLVWTIREYVQVDRRVLTHHALEDRPHEVGVERM